MGFRCTYLFVCACFNLGFQCCFHFNPPGKRQVWAFVISCYVGTDSSKALPPHDFEISDWSIFEKPLPKNRWKDWYETWYICSYMVLASVGT